MGALNLPNSNQWVKWNLENNLNIPIGHGYTWYLVIFSLSIPHPLDPYPFSLLSSVPQKNDLYGLLPFLGFLFEAPSHISLMRDISKGLESRGREARIFLSSESHPDHLWQFLCFPIATASSYGCPSEFSSLGFGNAFFSPCSLSRPYGSEDFFSLMLASKCLSIQCLFSYLGLHFSHF